MSSPNFLFLGSDLPAVLPLHDLTLESVKNTAFDRYLLFPSGTHQKIGHCRILNALSQALGLGRDWSGSLEHNLQLPAETGALRRVDMFLPSGRLNDVECRPTARQVADRLFHQGEGVTTIYVGHGVSWEWFDGTHPRLQGLPQMVFAGDEDTLFERDLTRALEGSDRAKALFLGKYWFDLQYAMNFLGDALVNCGVVRSVCPTAYLRGTPVSAQVLQRWGDLLGVLLHVLPEIGGGWARVHWISPRMAALVMPNGDYDIVIRAARISPPQGWGAPAGLPCEPIGLSHYYFQDRWEERDRHIAEGEWYASAEPGQQYPNPGTDELLYRWWARQSPGQQG